MTPADLDALWNFSDPAASEQRFRACEEAARAGGPDLYLEWQTQLARTQSLQRKFAEAHEILDRVEPQLGGSARPRLRYLLERGRTFNSAKEVDKALPLFTAAWELGQASGEEALAVDAAHMVAIAEQGEASLAWNQKALAYARTCTDPKARRWVGSLTNNMGWSYHELGRHEDALACFQENEAWHAMAEGQRPYERHIARWSIARQLRALGRLQEALDAQRVLLDEARALDKPDGYTNEEIAECMHALGRPAEAAPHFARAFEVLSQDPWHVANEQPRLERLRQLAQQGVQQA